MAAQVDIHAPDRDGDQRNIHAHIMLTTRQVTRNGFKAVKPREWNKKQTLKEWRDQWAEYVNKSLERAGSKERVDARSFKDQGIDGRVPGKHLGPAATAMERKGQRTDRGEQKREAEHWNRDAAELEWQLAVVNEAIKAEEQKAVKEKGGGKEKVQASNKDWDKLQDEQVRAAANTQTRQERFDAWAGKKRAELQNRQLEQRADFRKAQVAEADRVRADLDAAYLEIEEHRRHGGLWYKIRYRHKDQLRYEALERNLEASEGRRREVLTRLENRQAEASKALDAQHRREGRVLEVQIGKAPEFGREEEARALFKRILKAWSREKDKDKEAGVERERGYGREL